MFDALRKWTLGGLGLVARVQALLDSHEKMSRAVAALQDQVQAQRLEIERLKAREEVLIARAEAAAAVAAGTVAMQATSDIARRLGGVETQLRALPPPRREP